MSNVTLTTFDDKTINIKKFPILLGIGHIKDEPVVYFPKHKHEDYSEIIYIYNGKGRYIINEKTYEVEKGDVVIFNNGVFHEEFSDPAESIETFYCLVGDLQIEGIDKGHIIPEDIIPVIHTEGLTEQIEFYISGILKECTLKNLGYSYMYQHYLLSLIIHILRLVNARTAVSSDDKSSSFGNRVKEYIDKNYNQEISLNDLAHTLHISQYYLSHIFKNELGYSPINYLIKRRIDEAKKLLLTTSKTVQEISKIVGYENPSYFNLIFKKVTGITPGKYKEDMTKRNAYDSFISGE